MTSKQRAEKRAQAHSLQPLFQVGKGGVSDALISQTDDALKANELIKLKALLETCPKPPKEIAREIAEKTGSEVVSVVGGSMVFYKYSEELHKKEKTKRENIIKAKRAARKSDTSNDKRYGKRN
ncbi:MAG: YhbY family RNA-binding protein [Oscillospiraceae bacterium]|jgi:RNA-binding protein|nr:YhbY family RNA-binding protein [Oscillospiraceae bacterium]